MVEIRGRQILCELDRVLTLRTVMGPGGVYSDAMTYDPDGSMITRTRNKNLNGMRTQRIEGYYYDAFNLVERFTVRKDATSAAGGEGCEPDATNAPLDDFRYRFGPLQEREQKRQYATSQDQAMSGLMWTYTLLGADAKQLASYNGIQGGFCGQTPNTVWMWPVEYNSYGPGQTRIITRPQGAKEFVISDHLGSARITLDENVNIVQSLDYQPFGSEINTAGVAARTSYIGREQDVETGLGFNGVRMYEPEYGRFMSVDPKFSLYLPHQPYHYSLNQPISLLDAGGKTVTATQAAAQTALSGALSEHFGVQSTFSDGGALQISASQVEQARSSLSGEDLNEFNGIVDMIESEKTLNLFTVDGSGERVPEISLTSPDGSSQTTQLRLIPGEPEYFVSSSDIPENAAIIFRPEVAATATYTAEGNNTTAPCGSCVLMHALIDHGMPWVQGGHSSTRQEGVKGHNSALKRKGETVVRDGKDHTNDGSQR